MEYGVIHEVMLHLGTSLVIIYSKFLTAEPGDILDLSELNPPSVIIPTLRPVDKIKYPIIVKPQPIRPPVELAYRKRRSIFEGMIFFVEL